MSELIDKNNRRCNKTTKMHKQKSDSKLIMRSIPNMLLENHDQKRKSGEPRPIIHQFK